MHFNTDNIESLEHRYKINLFNSISGYKSANLIATKANDKKTNVAIFSSVVHYGSNPPILGFVTRPHSVPRNTYENIKETGFYTINHVNKSFFKDAHHTSAKYDKNVSEFDMTSLREIYKNNFFAPYVEQSSVQIGLKFLEEYVFKANDTILLLGRVIDLHVNDNLISEDGFVDLTKGDTAAINGLDGYSFPSNNDRLPYQRPLK